MYSALCTDLLTNKKFKNMERKHGGHKGFSREGPHDATRWIKQIWRTKICPMSVPPLSQLSSRCRIQRLVWTRMWQTPVRPSRQEQTFGHENILWARTRSPLKLSAPQQKKSSVRYWFSSPGKDLNKKKYNLLVNACVCIGYKNFAQKYFYFNANQGGGQGWKARNIYC